MSEPDSYFGEFKLSVTEALRAQLIARLGRLTWAPLTDDALAVLATRGGVYQLALDGSPVYVGKSKSSLPDRLHQHKRKLSGRRPAIVPDGLELLVERVTFRCVYVDEDLDAVAPEKMLMSELGRLDQAAWNFMGFGNKDPGRNRDRSLVKDGHFDRLYPINLRTPITLDVGMSPSLLDVMTQFKKATPFTYRFGEKVPNVPLEIQAGPNSARASEWIGLFADCLPAGWVTVSLPGYVIVYPSLDVHDFASRTGSWTSTGGSSTFATHSPTFEAGVIAIED